MKSRYPHLFVAAWIGILGMSGANATAEMPEAVSPGAVDQIAEIEARCPTFSWGSVSGADWYELEVYRLDEAGEVVERVVQQTFAGSVTSWTPSLDLCLERGRSYTWWVRTVGEEGLGAWSRPAWFTVSSHTTDAEFQEALEVVRNYIARSDSSEGVRAVPTRSVAEGRGHTDTTTIASVGMPKALASPAATAINASASGTSGVTFGVHGISQSATDGSAGMVGQSTAASGVTHGVYGQVESSSGVAGAFDNTAGGKILSGLNNSSEVFSVGGTGAVTATSFAGSGAGVTDVVAADLSCTACLDGSEIAANAVGVSELDIGAVFEPALNSGSTTNVLVDTLYDVGETVATISIDAPADGTVFALASSIYFCNNCSASNVSAAVYCTLSTSPSAAANSGDETYHSQEYNAYGQARESFAIHDVFSVTAGITTVYLRCGVQMSGDQMYVAYPHFSLIFIPS